MKYKNRYHNIQNKEYVPHVNIIMWLKGENPTIHLVPGKESICIRSTVMSQYHYRFGSNMGGDKFEL